ncbi:BlaI/MecI/CopY family transcriptional regulator [Flavobacteriaceae bacterium M23B6Z8]
MKELTKSEEQLMQYLWKLKKAFLKDIYEEFQEPRPAYTTISTVIRVLVKKQFIGYHTYGKVHEYFPLVTKETYFKARFKSMVQNFFSGSMSSFAHFFTENEEMDLTELEKMKAYIEAKIESIKEENE